MKPQIAMITNINTELPARREREGSECVGEWFSHLYLRGPSYHQRSSSSCGRGEVVILWLEPSLPPSSYSYWARKKMTKTNPNSKPEDTPNFQHPARPSLHACLTKNLQSQTAQWISKACSLLVLPYLDSKAMCYSYSCLHTSQVAFCIDISLASIHVFRHSSWTFLRLPLQRQG